MIRDVNLDWLRKRVFYPAQSFQNLILPGGATPTGINLITLESTTSKLTTVSGTKYTGLQVSVTPTDGADWVSEIPYDLDPTHEIGLTVLWTKGQTGATHLTSATWAVLYKAFKTGTQLITAATALTTAITAQTVTNTDDMLLYRSPRGIISPTDIATNIAQTAWLWSFRVQLAQATGQNTDLIWMLGLEVDYMPRRTYGPGGSPRGVAAGRAILTNPFGPAQTYTS